MEHTFEDIFQEAIKFQGNLYGLIKVHMRESLVIINFKEKENLYGKMPDLMKDTGKII